MKTLTWFVVAILLVVAGVAGRWFGVAFLAPYAGVLLTIGIITLCVLGCRNGCPCCACGKDVAGKGASSGASRA